MKEHAGGPPPSAFIPITHWGEENFEIHPIVVPDVAARDRLSDRIREVEDRGEDPVAFCLSLLAPALYEALGNGIRRIFALISESQNPLLAIDQLRWASGAALRDGQTIGDLARRHGIAKQAFQQGAKPYRALLAIRSQTARTDEARQRMSLRNSRRFNHEGAPKAG